MAQIRNSNLDIIEMNTIKLQEKDDKQEYK